jgi:hypothetical protein
MKGNDPMAHPTRPFGTFGRILGLLVKDRKDRATLSYAAVQLQSAEWRSGPV